MVQQAYVEGVSTRRVDDLVKALGCEGISKSLVSRICQELDEVVDSFGDETPLVERSGARALNPLARGVRGGALVGDAKASKSMPIRFPDDLRRRHHLYVARTRMGKSTLMHHLVTHKMREKAEGRDSDAIVVIDPHTDLVSGILEHVPWSGWRRGCGSSGGRGCSPSSSRPSRPSTRPTSTRPRTRA